MRILLLGKTGLLGKALLSVFQDHHRILAASHNECDITNKKSLEAIVHSFQPELVINATGYTAVDRAEDEKDAAFAVNAEGVRSLCEILAPANIPLVHFSTDYVFNGEKSEGYAESDSPSPISAYGASKAAGEQAVLEYLKNYFLIRTAWLYGPGGKNFVDTMLTLVEEGKPLKIVNDQRGNPTYTLDLAQAILRLLNGKAYGIYHIVNEGNCAWHELAVEIFRQLGVPQEIIPITSAELNRKAKRPQYSMLLNTKLPKLRPWREALSSYLQQKQLLL